MVSFLPLYTVLGVFGVAILIFMETSAGKRWLESYD